MIIQCLTIAAALISILLTLLPCLPLIKDWPAQWIGLVSGLDKLIVEETISGTSVGGQRALGKTVVYISSARREGRPPSLEFSTTCGKVEKRMRV
jgi:hypothetical protein